MPPPTLINLDELDFNRVLYTREQIYQVLPQRHEFSQLDAIVHLDTEMRIMVGYRDVRSDEWWCRGHMPGKPIFPGVLMVEACAQLAAFGVSVIAPDPGGFMGFGGIDEAKFRDSVVPPTRIILACRAVDVRKRRFISETQAYVGDKIIFEGRIIGLRLSWS